MRNPGGFSQRKALRDLLRSLDRDLKDVRERIYLATDDEINNYDKLMKSVSEKEKTLTGRQITIDIACGDMGTLEMYLGKGVKGLIFRPENEKDPGKIVQVEGIIAALRALHIDDPAQRNERLGRIFTLLTGDPVPPDLPTDLRELAKKLQFILPPIGKRDQDKELRGLNDNMFKLLVAA
jgi:S-adenosylmethionine synthetase